MLETENAMLYWIAAACRELRGSSAEKLVAVAMAAGKTPSSVFRFEDGQTGYPRSLDAYVQAYADVCGAPSAIDVWNQALRMWITHEARERGA